MPAQLLTYTLEINCSNNSPGWRIPVYPRLQFAHALKEENDILNDIFAAKTRAVAFQSGPDAKNRTDKK
jgi:hypothetical protein